MNLYVRDGSPYWWMSFSIHGQRIRESTKRPLSDKAGASRFMMSEYEKRMNQAQFGEKPDVTVREAMELTVESVTGKTQTSYDLSMRKWLGIGFDDVWSLPQGFMLSRLSQDHLDAHSRNRLAEGLKANSINIEIRFIKRVANLNSSRFLVNPDLRFPLQKAFKKTRYLSEQEEETVLDSLRKEDTEGYRKAYDLGVFLLDTGVRLNEALGLDWIEINMSEFEIEVYRSKTDTLSLVPISDRVAEILQRRHNQEKPFEGMSRGIRILRKTIADNCNQNPKIVARRGAATLHTLRDTYATRMLARGVSLQEVSKLLGHSNIQQTMKYAQLEDRAVVSKARRALNM
ncbi:MAG: site-specific integrase [Pseudomonadota bacterium]